MKEFVFGMDYETQIDDFKRFTGNPEDVKYVEINCITGDNVRLSSIGKVCKMISECISENAEMKFDTELDENLGSDEMIVKVKI